jgi:Ca-activated chloride channel family protein
MILKHPSFLLLFLVYIPLIAWYIWKHTHANPYLEISTTKAFDKLGTSWKLILNHALFGLRLLTIGALIVALARPQSTSSFSTSQIEGTDICLALDVSSSMTASDLQPTRFQAAKKVASGFINGRENDNMALVIFASESLSLLPLTNDRTTLLQTLENVTMGQLPDGTAIGDGLASAINRISSGKAKSKSIILLTDGSNNSGDVAPSTAAQIAKSKGIKVYTIGVGTNGSVRVQDPFGFPTTIETKIDEASLREIADMTGGKYFRATDNHTLSNVFKEIDKLEKTRLDATRYSRTSEAFMPWVTLALILLSLELLLRHTILRRIP